MVFVFFRVNIGGSGHEILVLNIAERIEIAFLCCRLEWIIFFCYRNLCHFGNHFAASSCFSFPQYL